jgi:DnaK suppressor protein
MSTCAPDHETTIETASERFARLQRLRFAQREELETGLRELRSSIAPADAADVNDVQAASDVWLGAEIQAASVEIAARTLQSIEHALERLRRGAYGVCSDCGSEIPAARLRALPFADRCRPCQERMDAERPLAG